WPVVDQRPRQLQGRFRHRHQELRRLPRDLPRQEELRTDMRRALSVVLGLAVIGAGAFWIATSPALTASGADEAPGGAPDLANGEAMFYAGGCTSCHATPGQDDKLRLGGGHALETTFGTFHVPNI